MKLVRLRDGKGTDRQVARSEGKGLPVVGRGSKTDCSDSVGSSKIDGPSNLEDQ